MLDSRRLRHTMSMTVFLVDVVCDVKEQVYAYWLYHKDCGVKVRYVQVPITNISNPEDVVNNIDPKF